MLPLRPAPPWHGVAEGAVIQEETIWHAGVQAHFGVDFRHLGRNLKFFGFEPRILRLAIIFKVMVQSHCHAVGVVATDDEVFAYGFDLETVIFSICTLSAPHAK